MLLQPGLPRGESTNLTLLIDTNEMSNVFSNGSTTKSSTLSTTTTTTEESEGIDVNFYYRFYNEFSGEKKALEIQSIGNVITLKMNSISRKYSQQFYFVPLIGGFVSIRNRRLGDEYSLDVVNDENQRDVVMALSGEYSGQMWKTIPSTKRLYRLFNSLTGNEKCLDVYLDNELAHMSDSSGSFAGQFWKLQKLGPVEKY